MKIKTVLSLVSVAIAEAVATDSLAQSNIWSDEFETAPHISDVSEPPCITQGVELLETYYCRGTEGNNARHEPTGGNPGGWLSVGLYGFGTGLTLAAHAESEFWAVKFDWQSTNGYGSNVFSVWGITAGQKLDLSFQYNPEGSTADLLFSTELEHTGGNWVEYSYTFNVPAGYRLIVLKWGHDLEMPRGGIDNLVVTSEVKRK